MAAGIAEKQLLIAEILVIQSYGCSVARILFAEQQQQEAARDLQESNALLKSVFEGTGDALFIKDLQGRYVITNQTYADLLELRPEYLVGKVSQFIDPDAATCSRRRARKSYRKAGTNFSNTTWCWAASSTAS
jgi:PAS domain-containing protein